MVRFYGPHSPKAKKCPFCPAKFSNDKKLALHIYMAHRAGYIERERAELIRLARGAGLYP